MVRQLTGSCQLTLPPLIHWAMTYLARSNFLFCVRSLHTACQSQPDHTLLTPRGRPTMSLKEQTQIIVRHYIIIFPTATYIQSPVMTCLKKKILLVPDCRFNCHKRCASKVPRDCLGEVDFNGGESCIRIQSHVFSG